MPGDVIGLLAHRYWHLHKVGSAGKGGDSCRIQERQIALTCWTDQIAEKRTDEYNSFYRARGDAPQ